MPDLNIKDYVIAGLAAALLALCVMCFVAIHLPFGIRIEGWKPKADRLQTEIVAMQEASKLNAAEQQRLLADQKAKYDAAAEKANATYQTELAAARSAAERYKLAHRVQPGTPGVSTPASPEESNAAGSAQGPAAPALVYITEPDFDACTIDYTYAQSVYEWAQSLVSNGTGEFAPTPGN